MKSILSRKLNIGYIRKSMAIFLVIALMVFFALSLHVISHEASTMVYSVVYDMTTRPNEYIGKTIRMKGNMSTYHDEETGKTYYACLIQDATACCAQGIEFQTTDEFKPSDYPEEGKPVTVLGRYDMYEENGYQYCILKDAVLE